MHNLMSLGTASLDTMGGLITNTAPADLPEGASPRTWDTDYIVGSVFTRPGLASMFAYSTTFNITSVSVNYGVATFTYAPNLATPTVNETFILSGFTGLAFPLNGQEISVTFVNASQNQFNAEVTGILNMSAQSQAGLAVSTVGSFIGPKTPTSAAQAATGEQWSNPTGILGSISYAQVVTTSITDVSSTLNGTAFAYAVQPTSGITGLVVTFQAYATAGTTLTVQLLKGGVPIGSPKTQPLTSTPTIYSLGASNDLWNASWLYSDINGISFGVQFSVTGAAATTFLNDVDTLVYVSPSLTNFNYVKSYIQNTGQTYTLALDASGDFWREDVTNNPGYLSLVLSGIIPGSFARSATADDQEYICFSNLAVGTDRPRVYTGSAFLPLSQVGPGAAPQFSSSVGNSGQSTLTLSAFSITSDVVTFTYTGTEPTAGQLYQITGVAAPYAYLNITGTVLSTGLSSTQFQMGINNGNVSPTSITGEAVLAFSYNISSITQPAPTLYPVSNFNNQILLWSAGPGSTSPGTTITAYYGGTPVSTYQDLTLINAVNSGRFPVYVYITGAPFANGTWQVTSVGSGSPPGEGGAVPYFTFTYTQSGYQKVGGPSASGNNGIYYLTFATVTTQTPIANVAIGDTLQIFSATPSAWNGSWTVLNTLTSGVMNVISTQMSASGVATYGYTMQSGAQPTPGELVTIINCTNNAIFNCTGVIATVAGGFFTINGFSSGAIPEAAESGAQAQTFGTQFIIDPGPLTVGTTGNPIYGNDTGTGTVSTIGGSVTPVGSGTRQAVVFFITESGLWTFPSPPVTFTTSADANYINVSNIPVGPPNVVARGIAITEAGQNGVAGANFYVIENQVSQTVNNVTTTYSSTIIRDNTTTSAKFTFTDAVLLNSTEIDIPGNNLFNLIELGSSAWCVPYAQRMFYGLQLNKVQNFNNLSFDGGYLPNPSGNLAPAGWNVIDGANITLNVSPVTGNSLYIFNSTQVGVIASAGLLLQSAYQDPYNVAIIQANTQYSIRVAARNPSGIAIGTLQITLQDYNSGIGLGTTYGTFQVPLTSMGSTIQVFTGNILTNPFSGTVSKNLSIAIQVLGLGVHADCEIDRIEVFPTAAPYLGAQVYGSYIDDLEAIDASGEGGIIDTSSENPQFCMGGFVLFDSLYLLKTSSLYVTEDNPNSEPGGWGLRQISNEVGTIGINSYDMGEEWAVTACRKGIFGFNGSQPVKVMQEIYNLWELINWEAGNTIVLRNDIINKRLLCAVPLPTPNQWLPFDPINPTPTSPNVILMCNYQGLNTFEEFVNSPQVHTTMFGSLAAVDMKRKWSIWRVKTPYMDFVMRPDNNTTTLLVCNGIQSSKIYQFLDSQLSDDGLPINGLYTTYGFVNAAKAATVPIFGFHQKRYTSLQFTAEGAGSMQITLYQNTLNAPYPYTVPAFTLQDPSYDDWFRPLNIRGNRCFISFSTNAVGSWFDLHKILLAGKADPWAPINPTGGGNAGA